MTTTHAPFGDPRLPVRFWSKVDRNPSGCWTWTACLSTNGYGKISTNGRSSYAHRVAHEALVGPIAEGMTLDHLCRVRRCVRPDHTEQVPTRENLRRGESPTAENGRKTHCAREGHPLSGGNLYVNPRGERECRTCRAAANARHDARRRSR